MADIRHRISIRADARPVYDALATIDGLASWWTTTTSGTSAPGETVHFRFGEQLTHMDVEALEPARRVAWRCTGTQPEWRGTAVTFELTEADGRTTVDFGHRGWREANDFFAHCSTKWATFLLSLKQLVETGKGRPFPHDLPT